MRGQNCELCGKGVTYAVAVPLCDTWGGDIIFRHLHKKCKDKFGERAILIASALRQKQLDAQNEYDAAIEAMRKEARA